MAYDSMRSQPPDIEDGRLRSVLAERWGLETRTLTYAPVGGGSHHWNAVARDGTALFVTVDDLDDKPWFGSGRDHVFGQLDRSYRVAAALREEAGLRFVVAPLPDGAGAVVIRLSPRYGIAVFPFVAGAPVGSFEIPAADRSSAVGLFAKLHGATPYVEAIAARLSCLAARSWMQRWLTLTDHGQEERLQSERERGCRRMLPRSPACSKHTMSWPWRWLIRLAPW